MSDWVIYTTMRRRWPDGTEFTIRPASPNEPRCLGALGGFQLTVTTPHGLKAHSWHPDVAAAKSHTDELLKSLTNPRAEDYRIDQPANDDQLELL